MSFRFAWVRLSPLVLVGLLACAASRPSLAAPSFAGLSPAALRLIIPNAVVVVLGLTWLALVARRQRRSR